MAEPAVRWVEPPGGQRTLAAVLRELGVADVALTSGAVFVNRERQTQPERVVRAADIVEVYPVRRGQAASCPIVARRGDLLLVDKPAALASEPTRQGGGDSVAEQFTALFGTRAHVHSRLDVGVSGLTLVALSDRARQHVERLRSQSAYHRHYVALASGGFASDEGEWRSKLGTRDAVTRYRVVERLTRAGSPSLLMLLGLAPITGRTHQLRAHAAAAGAPLLGDKRYGGVQRLVSGQGSVVGLGRIMLHAARVDLADVNGQPWQVVLPPPHELTDLWTSVGGSQASLSAATSLDLLG